MDSRTTLFEERLSELEKKLISINARPALGEAAISEVRCLQAEGRRMLLHVARLPEPLVNRAVKVSNGFDDLAKKYRREP